MVHRLLIALLIVFAGCAAAPGGEVPDRTSGPGESPPTTSESVTSSSATSATPSPGVPADATEANTVEYAELSPVQRRVFDAAAADGAKFFAETRYVESDYPDLAVAEPFETHDYVRKDGTFYRLSSRTGDVLASYGIQATEGPPSENDTVVAYANLSERTREPVRRAIENGSYSTPFGKWSTVPGDLSRAEYVRYSGTHYWISVVVGDAWVQVWTAEAVG